MIYRGAHVIPVTGEIIEDGAIAVRGGKIAAVDAFMNMKKEKDEIVRDLRPLVLMPGLINCHCHLEEGVLRSELDLSPSFTAWYTRVQKYIADADIRKRFNAVRLGVLESMYYGTTTIADTAVTGSSFLVLREEKIRSYVFVQFKGLIPWQAKAVFGEMESRINLLDWVFPDRLIGLSPQSPYSTSIELYRLALKKVKEKQMLFQTHLAEHNEELEMFSSHSGPLYEYSQIQHEMDLKGCTKGSGFFMFKNNLVPNKCIIIHGNYLSADELESLAHRKASLVHCAQSHAFFGHKDFPFEAAVTRGLNIALGTESLASSPTLSIFDDMHCIKQHHPELSSRKILEFATINGARALGIDETVGALAKGYEADIIGIRIGYQPGDDMYDEIVTGNPQVEFVMIKGEELIA